MDWAKGFFNSQGHYTDSDDFFQTDFTDVLFCNSSTSPQLFPFPNPREIGRNVIIFLRHFSH